MSCEGTRGRWLTFFDALFDGLESDRASKEVGSSLEDNKIHCQLPFELSTSSLVGPTLSAMSTSPAGFLLLKDEPRRRTRQGSASEQDEKEARRTYFLNMACSPLSGKAA